MLYEITIENVAVIEKATAVFGQGFTVLTGETGAGKSILIDSINAILGSRTSKDIVRSGADKAKIWATFNNVSQKVRRIAEEAGYPIENELLLYREINADGKSNCRINGQPATASILREVCEDLINIHGQHDSQSLLNPAKHIDILDGYAKNDALREEYSRAYTKLRSIEKSLNSLSMDEEEKAKKIEILRYEVDEIEKAELAVGEEEDLIEKRDIIHNAQTILQAINGAFVALSGDENGEILGAYTQLGTAAELISDAAKYDDSLSAAAETLREMFYTAKDVASELQSSLDMYEFDGYSLDTLEERLYLIYKMKQKYGEDIGAILSYGEEASRQLEEIEFQTEHIEKLEQEKAETYKIACTLADELMANRMTTFQVLNARIAKALEFLNMSGITLAVQHKTVDLTPKGKDSLEFYISTNPGEDPKPLAKIASGGELSRIMLALKSALAERDEIGTVIYDEIDTGVSGLAAGRIGQLLQMSAKGRQVICVTHTAQVAVYALEHLLIEKSVQDGRTFTNICTLSSDERVGELARIISGDNITEIAKANAAEMLKKAHTPK